MEIHFGCAQTRASRRMWCLAARGSGLGPRTSRAANTMSRGNGVKGHTRSEADDESRTRGPDPMTHGVVVLCQLSYIRKSCEAIHRPVPRSPRSMLLKSVHRCPPASVVRSSDRGSAPMRRPVEVRNERGPDPSGVRASAYRAWRERVYALPSPGCIRSSCRAPGNAIAAARTNATRPLVGRWFVVTCLDFTMKRFEEGGAR